MSMILITHDLSVMAEHVIKQPLCMLVKLLKWGMWKILSKNMFTHILKNLLIHFRIYMVRKKWLNRFLGPTRLNHHLQDVIFTTDDICYEQCETISGFRKVGGRPLCCLSQKGGIKMDEL